LSSPQPESPRFVLDVRSGRHFPEEAFQAAFNSAFLAYVSSAVPSNATARQATRAIRALKSGSAYRSVLSAALRSLETSGGLTAEEVAEARGEVVAAFTGSP
jgi:hypothetical protein